MICLAVSSTHGSGTVGVHLIPTPRDDEADHMPMSGTRMHPGGLAFILFFLAYLPLSTEDEVVQRGPW